MYLATPFIVILTGQAVSHFPTHINVNWAVNGDLWCTMDHCGISISRFSARIVLIGRRPSIVFNFSARISSIQNDFGETFWRETQKNKFVLDRFQDFRQNPFQKVRCPPESSETLKSIFHSDPWRSAHMGAKTHRHRGGRRLWRTQCFYVFGFCNIFSSQDCAVSNTKS